MEILLTSASVHTEGGRKSEKSKKELNSEIKVLLGKKKQTRVALEMFIHRFKN